MAPDGYERFLALAAIVLLAAALLAIARGQAHWGAQPTMLWVHLVTVLLATALTPVLLLRPRGNAQHRLLGFVWVAAMLLTAAGTLFLQMVRPGHFSWIHLLSLLVLGTVPLLWWTARTHQVARHRRTVRALVTGALVIAGYFTFPFDRLLGHWLFA